MSRERRKLQELADRRTKVFGMNFGMEVGPATTIEADRFPIQIKLSDGTDSRDQPHVELLNAMDVWALIGHLTDLIIAFSVDSKKVEMQVLPGDAQYTILERERNCEQYEECYRTDPHGHLSDGGLGVRTT